MAALLPNLQRHRRQHQQQFAQISINLAKLASKLVAEHPEFAQGDFGRAFLVTAVALMTGATGPEATAAYLHELTDQLALSGKLHAAELLPPGRA